MPRKKKSFINRKTAQNFHVVHRSQRELLALGEGASEFVLMPVGPAKAAPDAGADEPAEAMGIGLEEAMADIDVLAEEDHVNEMGLPNDGYDYTRHVKEGGGTGAKFLSATPQQEALNELLSRTSGVPKDVLPGQEAKSVKAVVLSEHVMDEDLYHALFEDAEEGDFEQIDDDFVLQAAGEAAEESKAAGEDFDEEQYMAVRIAASRAYMSNKEALEEAFEALEFDADDHSRRPMTEAEEHLAAEFEVTMEGYESDEIGELDDANEAVRGATAMGYDNPDVQQMMEEFMHELHVQKIPMTFRAGEAELGAGDAGKDDDDDDEEEEEAPALIGVGGAGKAPAPGEGMAAAAAAAADEEEAEEGRAGAAGAAGDGLAIDEQRFVGEDAGGDGDGDEGEAVDKIMEMQPYLRPVMREEWDCESVLSTLSTTDNLPSVIAHPRRRKKRGDARAGDYEGLGADFGDLDLDDAPEPILLSSKTGMPLGVLPGMAKSTREAGANLGKARDRKETAEEKRARKALVKAERRAKRELKKQMRQETAAA